MRDRNESAPPAKAAPAGRRLRIGKFQVLSHIATGGMGAVYKARDTGQDRVVALKVLPPELVDKPGLLERFTREARHGEKLRHENIVTLYESGEDNGIHYMALEYVEGLDLLEYIQSKGRVSVAESRQIVVQAARALDYLHEQGIVHRDIKPANFLLARPHGRLVVKLIDLGLSRQVGDEGRGIAPPGAVLGTLDYLSPEQARDRRSADIRSDIYSLGCTWYHMLAGRPPFTDGTLADRIRQHAELDPPSVRQWNPDVPPDVLAVLMQMMAKDPEHRYQTPVTLLWDLEPDRRGELMARSQRPPAVPAPTPALPPAPKPSADDEDDEEGSSWGWLTVAALLVIVAALAWLYYQHGWKLWPGDAGKASSAPSRTVPPSPGPVGPPRPR